MKIEKMNPWNWFKHEDGGQGGIQQIPVARDEASGLAVANDGDSLVRLYDEMDKLFDEMFSSFGLPAIRPNATRRLKKLLPTVGFVPKIDVAGDDKSYEVVLDVPGLSESDLSIDVKGDRLIIKGQKEEKSESKDKQFYRVERSYGSFQRTLSLPDDAEVNDIQATLKDGVLKLAIPRKDVVTQDVKRINIASAS